MNQDAALRAVIFQVQRAIGMATAAEMHDLIMGAMLEEQAPGPGAIVLHARPLTLAELGA